MEFKELVKARLLQQQRLIELQLRKIHQGEQRDMERQELEWDYQRRDEAEEEEREAMRQKDAGEAEDLFDEYGKHGLP